MSVTTFRLLISIVAIAFTAFVGVVVMPPLIESGDVVAALAAGFVNPYAAGYSLDTISCWFVLAIWIFHEAKTLRMRHGWVCLLLGIFPGVAVGFGLYLLLRSSQLTHARETAGI